MDKTRLKSPTVLLLRGELIAKLKVTKAQLNAFLKDGMPHYLIGNEFRFLEDEVLKWLETYKPSQERLESEFRDKKGRTLAEYVTKEIILSTLRITKENLAVLCRKGMPFVQVGEKDFFHIQDILDYYHRGDGVINENKGSSKPQKSLIPLCENVSNEIPVMIIDGSYNFKKHKAGTGIMLVENGEKITAITNVREIKTTKPIVCEVLALLDALKMVKMKKFNEAVIFTDQKPWTKGISMDSTTYEEAIKPYIKEVNTLLKELKGKISIKFVGELTNGNKNEIYNKAHSLSKEYKKGIKEA